MSLLTPLPPPYDPIVWAKAPLSQRGQQVCSAWALQGYGSPLLVYALYAVKVLAYVGGWAFFCGFSPTLGSWAEVGRWWLEPLAFQKAIVWSLLFEGLGFGCGSGPLTGRYLPPVGGFLYFLRPGTTKLALFPALPVLGGIRRSVLDVVVYLAILVCAGRVLIAPTVSVSLLLPLAVLVPVMGVLDRTPFLAMRAEHFWTTIVCMVAASGTAQWLAGAKAVQLALWFFAGFSKLNHHFPSVVGVMTSNSPVTRFAWMRRAMYARFPEDLRPSRLAVWMAHGGTLLELAVPTVLLFARPGWSLVVGMIFVFALHGFITSNVPMGVPIEWNVVVVYGACVLFWKHPEVSPFAVGSWGLGAFLAIALVGVPIAGNLWPSRVSFLLAMRYYAGNWAYGVWLFRGNAHEKLRQLTTTAPWVYEQLERFYDRPTAVGVVGKVMGFRMMHLHGRALSSLLPRAVDRLEDYEYLDGEIVAGLVLGWNFGDGHLHDEKLLRAVQAQCGFEPGELRCVFVEAQPLFQRGMAYRIHDAATGLVEGGEVIVEELRGRQPWESPAR